jgi:hypothetical protein
MNEFGWCEFLCDNLIIQYNNNILKDFGFVLEYCFED